MTALTFVSVFDRSPSGLVTSGVRRRRWRSTGNLTRCPAFDNLYTLWIFDDGL